MSLKPIVALSQDFLGQLAKLPAGANAKVLKWATRFQADPASPGIHYETIQGARDENLRSVRLDRDLRGIVFKPPRGDVYVLLYVGHHDDAYRWAEGRKLVVNPVTGAMQLVVLEEAAHFPSGQVPAVVDWNESESDAPGVAGEMASLVSGPQSLPFSDLGDRQLMGIGVPPDLLGRVRALQSEVDLDGLQSSLPVEAYEGLFLLLAGDSISQILAARETRVDQAVDTDDFAASLDTPEAQSRFVVVADDEAMRDILNAPLVQWRVFLHPTQNMLARGNRSGPMRVLGQAGTGKTVLAMHRARWLAQNCCQPGQKVLFTTFTRNLASDIAQNLRTLCDPETLKRIEVTNLDAWVARYIRSHKLEHRIVYDRQQNPARQAWELALANRDTTLNLPDGFYEQELEQIILAQGVTTRDAYRAVRRTGRGVILNRARRDAIWPVFEEYRGQLASRKLKEVDDAYREVAAMLDAQRHDGERQPGGDGHPAPYAAIVVDETQDLGPQALKVLRALIAPGANDLFFVGDGHQRIYGRNRAVMSHCGIEIRGRSRKLYLNYRTTEEIRRQAVALLEGCPIDDLDGQSDESRRYKSLSHGPAPICVAVDGLAMAAARIRAFIDEWRGADLQHPSLCVIAPGARMRDDIGRLLESDGLRCVTISAQDNFADAQDVIHLATMHRAKGLEFDCVAVLIPESYLGPLEDSAQQRSLVYVALTRARRGALMLRLG